MFHVIIFMLLTGLCWTLVGILFGKAPEKRKELFSFFAISCACSTLCVWSFQFPTSAPASEVVRLGALMLPSIVAEIGGYMLMKYAMMRGSQGLAWCIVQSSLIVPFLGAIFFLHSKAEMLQYFGAALLLSGLLLSGVSSPKNTSHGQRQSSKYSFLLPAFGAFFLIGITAFLRIIPGNAGFSEATLSWRLPLMMLGALAIWSGYVAWTHSFTMKNVWGLAVIYGVIVALGQALFFAAVDAGDRAGVSAVVYPVAIGISLVFFPLYCVIVRKEKISSIAWYGITAITAGIFLLSIV